MVASPRLLAVPLLVLAALAAPAPTRADAAPRTPVQAAARQASVTLDACTTGTAPQERAATFVARMRAEAGAVRLQMRFLLRARAGESGRWRGVTGEGLGAWLTSDAGVRGYVFAKRVERLVAPGLYRAVVQFRWLDAGGAVIARSRAVSPVCRQPRVTAGVRPVDLRVEPVAPGLARYRVDLRNEARTPAAPVEVHVTVGAVALPHLPVPAVAGLETRTVEVVGVACTPGTTVDVLVVPANARTKTRTGEDLRRACPLPVTAVRR